MATAPPEKTSAGKGVLAIAGAKMWFVVAGFVVQFALPKAMGSEAAFGVYALGLSLISVLNNVLVTATVQSVSKLVSESVAGAAGTLRKALRVQSALGFALLLAVAALSEVVSRVYRDPALGKVVLVASGVVCAYAVYATLVGALNGRQEFGRQAAFDATFTLMRSSAILGGAFAAGALGAMGGFAAAAVAIAIAALAVVGTGDATEGPTARRLLAVMAPTWAFQGGLNGLLQLDGWILKSVLTARGSGSSEAIADAVNATCGIYKGAQNFAFAPYQLVLTAALVVFPMVSKATASGDDEAAKVAIRAAGRFSFLAAIVMAAPIAGASRGVLDLPYPEAYVAGAPALSVLAFGIVAFTLFVLAATVLAGAGRPSEAALASIVGLVLMLGADIALASGAASPDDALVRVATGTSAAMAITAALASARVVQRFGTFVPAATMLRGALAATAGFASARLLDDGGALRTLIALVAGGVAGLAVLGSTGELADFVAALRSRLARRKAD